MILAFKSIQAMLWIFFSCKIQGKHDCSEVSLLLTKQHLRFLCVSTLPRFVFPVIKTCWETALTETGNAAEIPELYREFLRGFEVFVNLKLMYGIWGLKK